MTLVEVDVLEATGRLDRLCNQCGRLTTWLYADTTRRPCEVPTRELAPTPPEPAQWDGKTGLGCTPKARQCVRAEFSL